MDDVVEKVHHVVSLSETWAVFKLLEHWDCGLESYLGLGNVSTVCVRGFSSHLTETVEDN
jgi:hypothetical protein